MSDKVMDRALDDVLEIELEEVKIHDDISRSISSNGRYVPHIYTNGAGYNTENGSEKSISTEYQFSENGDLPPFDVSKISYEDIITEDDEPVDNFPSEKQQRLLVNPLYDSSHLERPMIAAANVGIFHHPLGTPIVPDMFLSMGVSLPEDEDLWDKENRTYYVWKMGKPPEVAVEVVSNKKGGEGGEKFDRYALLEVKYYVILDHHLKTQNEILTVYELINGQYVPRDDYDLPEVNLSLTFWEGTFEDFQWRWIRWCDLDGNMILLGKEDAERERARAEREQQEKIEALARVETTEAEAEVKVEQAEVKAEQAEVKAEQARAEAERERQEKLAALEHAATAQAEAEAKVEQAKAEAARQLERILEQARAAGITLDI